MNKENNSNMNFLFLEKSNWCLCVLYGGKTLDITNMHGDWLSKHTHNRRMLNLKSFNKLIKQIALYQSTTVASYYAFMVFWETKVAL